MYRCLIISLVFFFEGCGHSPALLAPNAGIETVHVETFPMLKQYELVYLGPDPGEEADFSELANLGVKTVINLQVPGEKGFSPERAQTEKEQVEMQGMDYISWPLSQRNIQEGRVERKQIEDLDKTIGKSSKSGLVFLHDNSGNRAALWLGWHLKEIKNYSTEASIENVKKAFDLRDDTEKTLRAALATAPK